MIGDASAAKRRKIQKAALGFCKSHYGLAGLKVEEQIHTTISWRPNFFLRKGSVIFAVEVGESLDPSIFKIVANDILHFSRPIALCLACPLEVFQSNGNTAKVKELKKLGIGVLTVDDNGDANLPIPCVPLAQHISEEFLAERIRDLPNRLRIAFRGAHETFSVNPGQGLQGAGQIVEAMVDSMVSGAIKGGHLNGSVAGDSAANKIDELYEALRPQRAALGGARAFLKTYRNVASHPARSAKEAMKKINGCRDGFFHAIGISTDLSAAMNTLGYRLHLHL